jgi:hypothetical protein
MAHGKNAAKRRDREYWSPRLGGKHFSLPHGKFAKWLTHRRERRKGDKETREEAAELPYEMPIDA